MRRPWIWLLAALLVLGTGYTLDAQQRIYGTNTAGRAVPILVDATGALILSPTLTALVFEGETDDAYETTLTVVDPTADRTATLPNYTGTIVVLANAPTADQNLIFEGLTADDYETTLAITDPTADRTITFPDATGTVYLNGSVLYSLANVEAVTTTKGPATTESGEIYTNTGDTDGAAITLTNDPTAGTSFVILPTVNQTITLTANTGESLYLNGAVCATSITGAEVGSSLVVRAAKGGNGGVWVAMSTGTWTCNNP